jgi:hypothetical protein
VVAVAAVDVDRLPGDEAGRRRGKVRDALGDVFGLAPPPERLLRDDLVEEARLLSAEDAFRGDETRV